MNPGIGVTFYNKIIDNIKIKCFNADIPPKEIYTMQIMRTINAAIGATKDRKFISKAAKGKIAPNEKHYCQLLMETSGPSVHAPNKVIKSWIKAYQENVQRIKNIEAINKPFEKHSTMSRIYHRLTNK